jgi:hypothetical protein
MFDFILQTILFISLALIIYLFARALPRVDDSGKVIHSKSIFDRILSRLPLREIDTRINTSFEKFLRKMKIVVMKSDNLINIRLDKIKKINTKNEDSGEEPNLFKEENSDTKE